MKIARARRRFWRAGLLLGFSIASEILIAQVLPPPKVEALKPDEIPGMVRFFVRQYRFEGNTAFADAELTKVTEPFANREVSSEELEQARRAITLYYVNHGFVNSGAVIPDQNPAGGVILIRIVEGVLTGIEVHGNKWLRDGYILPRVKRWATPPLNLDELREGLQLLRQNPNVRQINAELMPGTAPGQSKLDVRVVDQQPFRLGLQVDNERPPSVGAEEIWLLASDWNVTGHSDVLDLRYGIADTGANGLEFSGADNMAGSYVVPVTRRDTTLGLNASRLNTALVEETFTPLVVSSVTTSYGVSLRQPFFQTANHEAAFGLGFDHRVNDTRLLGERFNISPGAENGEMEVNVLRISQEWLQRGQNNLLALRSTFNLGLDVFDSSDNGVASDPDGRYFSWLGQGQYVQRLFNTQNQLILRAAGQWTAEPLLALEQISVGGSQSVRGYRENQLVRDRGVIGSVEFRLPIFFDKAGAGVVYLAPFFDFGGAWNVRNSAHPTTIESTGIGVLINPNRHFHAQLFWGHRLREVETPQDDDDPQDLGLHFRINIDVF
jgi:hemolysin activation/secretion protein